MLTGYGERWRVIEAAKLGINEFLIKPVSAKTLRDRMVSILARPRASVQIGDYYGPMPRKLIDAPIAPELPNPAGGTPLSKAEKDMAAA